MRRPVSTPDQFAGPNETGIDVGIFSIFKGKKQQPDGIETPSESRLRAPSGLFARDEALEPAGRM